MIGAKAKAFTTEDTERKEIDRAKGKIHHRDTEAPSKSGQETGASAYLRPRLTQMTPCGLGELAGESRLIPPFPKRRERMGRPRSFTIPKTRRKGGHRPGLKPKTLRVGVHRAKARCFHLETTALARRARARDDNSKSDGLAAPGTAGPSTRTAIFLAVLAQDDRLVDSN